MKLDGYRSITAYLRPKGYRYIQMPIQKYMNIELELHSLSVLKSWGKASGTHKMFENKLNRTSMRTSRINHPPLQVGVWKTPPRALLLLAWKAGVASIYYLPPLKSGSFTFFLSWLFRLFLDVFLYSILCYISYRCHIVPPLAQNALFHLLCFSGCLSYIMSVLFPLRYPIKFDILF